MRTGFFASMKTLTYTMTEQSKLVGIIRHGNMSETMDQNKTEINVFFWVYYIQITTLFQEFNLKNYLEILSFSHPSCNIQYKKPCDDPDNGERGLGCSSLGWEWG